MKEFMCMIKKHWLSIQHLIWWFPDHEIKKKLGTMCLFPLTCMTHVLLAIFLSFCVCEFVGQVSKGLYNLFGSQYLAHLVI